MSRIAALEESIGGRLLARVPGGWELTDLGREALSAAESVEAAVRSLAADPAGSRALEGVVRMSATDGFSAYVAAPAAARRRPEPAPATIPPLPAVGFATLPNVANTGATPAPPT